MSAKSKLEGEMEEKRSELRKQELSFQKKEDEVRRSYEKNRTMEKELDQGRKQISVREQEIQQLQAKYDGLIAEELKNLELSAHCLRLYVLETMQQHIFHL